MNWKKAVNILSGKINGNIVRTRYQKIPGSAGGGGHIVEITDRELAIEAIHLDTGADGDWIAEGDWDGNETVDQIKQEWNELN